MRNLSQFVKSVTLTFCHIATDRRGATAIEYALVASFISVAAVIGFENLGSKVDARYTAVDQAIAGAI